jgi:hypothetical protein
LYIICCRHFCVIVTRISYELCVMYGMICRRNLV